MKRLSVLVGVILLLFSINLATAAVPGDQGALDKSEFFPLKVGTTWEYLAAGKKILVKVAAHEKVQDMLCAKLETDAGGVAITEHVTVKDGFVLRVQANGQKIEPPFKILKLPPADKEKWDIKCMLPGYPITGFLSTSTDKVKVGGKDYDAFLVTASDLKIGGQDATMKTWFAKDVGMVKQIFTQPNAGLDVTLELEKFTAGK